MHVLSPILVFVLLVASFPVLADGPPEVWSSDRVGAGLSTVAVGGGAVFTQGSRNGVEHIIALNEANGDELWTTCPEPVQEYIDASVLDAIERLDKNGDNEVNEAEALPRFKHLMQPTGDNNRMLTREELRSFLGGFRHPAGDGPRAAPVLAGDFVYSLGANGDLACLDAKTGKTKWHKNLVRDFAGALPVWGYAESPLVTEDLVVVTPGGKKGALLALDKLTGETKWRSEKMLDDAHYSSAVLADVGDNRQVIQVVDGSVVGVSLQTGELLWRYSRPANSIANHGPLLVSGSLLLASSGYGRGFGLLRIPRGAIGGRKETAGGYFQDQIESDRGGLVKVDDYIYVAADLGLACMNFTTGKVMWQCLGVGKGSICAVDGTLIVLGENHDVLFAVANPFRYVERGRFRLADRPGEGRPLWSRPVVANGRLYVRDRQFLTSFDVRPVLAEP